MNIVFFGTNEFSATVAEAILNSEHKILAIVAQPDKANSRGGKVKFNALKQFALNNNIPLHQFAKLNIEGEEVLRGYNADFFVTASYGQIIKQNILDLPKYCIVNVHGSLLPKYRGPAPIQWSIINGEKVTGVTIMKTELGLDCGEMYLKKQLEILPEDTSDSVFNKLATLGGEAIVEFLDDAEHYINNGELQDESQMTYFPMLTKEMAHIDFNTPSEKLVNLIRGQYSCNTMYFIFNGARYKVGFAKVVEGQGSAGEVLEASAKKGLIVATSDSAIEITKIQPEGKPMMDARAFCNGGKIKVVDVVNKRENMKNYFIIHGTFGHNKENWFGWLEKELQLKGFDVYNFNYPTPEGHNFENWSKVLDQAKDKISEESVFVCHSSAPIFVIKYCLANNVKIGKLISVSGANNFKVGVPEFDDINKFMFVDDVSGFKDLCKERICFYAKNDPYIKLEALEDFAKSIDAKALVYGDAGHFNASAGYTEFNDIKEYL